MKAALYPGSFDPITYGHLDIVERAARLCDKLYIAVMVNSVKQTLFAPEERVALITQAIDELPNHTNIEIISHTGLVAELARTLHVEALIKGIRTVDDWTAEWQMAVLNKTANPALETVFLPTSAHLAHISSGSIKEFAGYGGSITAFTPECVARAIEAKMGRG